MGKRKAGTQKAQKKGKKPKYTADEVMEVPEEERTLEHWKSLPEQTLVLTAGSLSLVQRGDAEELAERIFSHYSQGVAPTQGTSAGQNRAPVGPSEDIRKLIREELTHFFADQSPTTLPPVQALSEASDTNDSPEQHMPENQPQLSATVTMRQPSDHRMPTSNAT